MSRLIQGTDTSSAVPSYAGKPPIIKTSPERRADQTRYETPLKFPLLDSFPRIFPQAAEQADVAFETRLSSNTTIRPRLKTLRSEVTRLVNIEERENLSSRLADLAEAYREDWSSGSDDDDDDM